MLVALHAMIYSDDSAATRAFLADVLRWPFVSEGSDGAAGVGGAGTGGTDPAEWLIFRSGPSELGVHPTSGGVGEQAWSEPRQHQVSLVCDDLDATMAELAARGAQFAGQPREMGFGRAVNLRVPGADDLLLYQAHHAAAYHLPAGDPPHGDGDDDADRAVPRDDDEWEARYAPEAVWSGRPNGALVATVDALTPGRAVDVGCGEGADAVWLAQHGWDVVAFDVAESALARGRAAAEAAGVRVSWLRAGLLSVGLPPGQFDLVTACYPALPRSAEKQSERALLRLVRPGGRLLLLTHDLTNEDHRAHGFDPDAYVGIDEVRSLLDEDWTIEVDERRPRVIDGGAGSGHHTDALLVARRR